MEITDPKIINDPNTVKVIVDSEILQYIFHVLGSHIKETVLGQLNVLSILESMLLEKML
jgi:hypothetical protein